MFPPAARLNPISQSLNLAGTTASRSLLPDRAWNGSVADYVESHLTHASAISSQQSFSPAQVGLGRSRQFGARNSGYTTTHGGTDLKRISERKLELMRIYASNINISRKTLASKIQAPPHFESTDEH